MMTEKRFLFLGNSHTYFNDMPALFQKFCIEGNFCKAEVSMLAFPYKTYRDHLKMETSLRYAMLYGKFDYLIMQQAAHKPCPDKEETLETGEEIIRLAREQNICPVQIVPWAEKAYPEHQAGIDEIYEELHDQTGVKLIPLGRVFSTLSLCEGMPDLYWKDGEHASPWGSYAAAAAIYASLSGKSPEGLSETSLVFAKDSDSRGQKDWRSTPYPLEKGICQILQRTVWSVISEEK